jgi:UDP-N-acetylmuramoyl-L-alanyl-D-glutamate--2,6-diaminopimelate ligase
VDRREAIRTALNLAGPEDIVLIAGKGHEKYQEIKGVKHPFDDKQILLEFFELLDK